MMFGSPAVPPPASPKNTTMMFGTPASNAAAAPEASSPVGRTTMMFGGGANPAPPQPPPAARSTMVFGTAASNTVTPPMAPQAAAAAKTTMMFGTPAAPPPASPKNTTMMFGTAASIAAAEAAEKAPQAPAGNANKTLVFGGTPPAAPPPHTPKNTTMMFGTAASNAAQSSPQAPAPVGRSTQLFGAHEPDPPAEETILESSPGQSNRTMMFGAPSDAPTEAPAAKNTTMMFGRSPIPKVTAGTVELAGYAAEEDKSESTVRVDAASVVAENSSDEPSPPPRAERTQRFAMSDVGGSGLSTPPAGGNAVQDRHNRTQLFAMNPSESNTPEGGLPAADREISGDMTLPPGAVSLESMGAVSDLHRTLPPDDRFDPPGVSLLSDANGLTPPEVRAAPPMLQPVGNTLTNLEPLNDGPRLAPLRLELPPEPGGSPENFVRSPAELDAQARDDAEALRAVRGGGSGRVVIIVLVLIAIALAGVLVWRLVGKDLLSQRVSPAALQSTEQALATLRFDDGQAQAKAVSQLSAVRSANPDMLEAQAALVIAHSFQFDDAQSSLSRAEERLNGLKKAEGASQTAIDELQATLISQTERAQQLKTQLVTEHGRLLALGRSVERGSTAELAFIRADGLALGVLGDVEAITRAESFRQHSPAGDDWAELIEPEYALNGGSSFDDAVERVKHVQARAGNSTFIRPFVLLARLELKRGNAELAAEQLDRAITLNGKHEQARELLASLKR